MTSPFSYYVPAVEDQSLRDEPFHRMREEGLTGAALSVFAQPTLEDWRRITHPERAWLLRCEDEKSGQLLGVGLFTPWRWRVWEFDFTAFRAGFPLAVAMARGGFAWMFAHAPVDAIMGVCPAHNRHAWRLAEACGFRVLGRIPGACWWARRERHADGVFVLADRETLTAAAAQGSAEEARTDYIQHFKPVTQPPIPRQHTALQAALRI